jgi:hypothetical protein
MAARVKRMRRIFTVQNGELLGVNQSHPRHPRIYFSALAKLSCPQVLVIERFAWGKPGSTMTVPDSECVQATVFKTPHRASTSSNFTKINRQSNRSRAGQKDLELFSRSPRI